MTVRARREGNKIVFETDKLARGMKYVLENISEAERVSGGETAGCDPAKGKGFEAADGERRKGLVILPGEKRVTVTLKSS